MAVMEDDESFFTRFRKEVDRELDAGSLESIEVAAQTMAGLLQESGETDVDDVIAYLADGPADAAAAVIAIDTYARRLEGPCRDVVQWHLEYYRDLGRVYRQWGIL